MSDVLKPKILIKKGFQCYRKYSFNSIINIIPRSRYRALDPNLAKKRIHNTRMLIYIYLSSGTENNKLTNSVLPSLDFLGDGGSITTWQEKKIWQHLAVRRRCCICWSGTGNPWSRTVCISSFSGEKLTGFRDMHRMERQALLPSSVVQVWCLFKSFCSYFWVFCSLLKRLFPFQAVFLFKCFVPFFKCFVPFFMCYVTFYVFCFFVIGLGSLSYA